MKLKLHLTLLLFFAFISTSNAQYGFGGHYGTGFLCFDCDYSLEAGPLLSNINGVEANERVGFYLGLYQYKEINDQWSLRFGLGYANLGAKLKENNENFVLHSMLIEPISVHYTFNKKFKTFLGGTLGAITYGNNPFSEKETGSTFFPDGIKHLDFSLFAGVGYRFTDNIDLNLKYNLGLTNLNDMEDSDIKWKMNYLSLGVAYIFR